MNAVIALCHFCELHGPSILFCTQPFHCTNHTPEDVLNGAVASPSSCRIMQSRLRSGSFSEEPVKCEAESSVEEVKSSRSRQSTCEACQSVEQGEPGFISIDKESHISYISMQYPEEQALYSILRHACVRSLSCEVCPGREGPIMFGDEASGYVFSYTFFLKDLQSRGFQRWYSLICVMMDRIYLVNTMQFLISNFKCIIEELQTKADILYKAEQAEKPQRDALLQPRNAFLTPDQFRLARSGQIYRSLVQITKDKATFQNLHQSFSWILQASGQCYTEKLLEGPPLEDYLYDEDDKATPQKQLCAMTISSYPDSSMGPVFESIKHMFQILGCDKFHLIAFHVVRGDQLIVQGRNQNTVESAIRVLKTLIPAGCCKAQLYVKEYKDSWRCNFLGLDMDAEIPVHVLQSQLFVLLKIVDENEVVQKSKSHFSSWENSFDLWSFSVQGSPIENEPSYLKSLMSALNNVSFNNNVFSMMLVTLKEQWMGKVKVMFKFIKTGVRSSEEKHRLLKVLHAKLEDEILLKYWLMSLSRSYRSHLLSNSE